MQIQRRKVRGQVLQRIRVPYIYIEISICNYMYKITSSSLRSFAFSSLSDLPLSLCLCACDLVESQIRFLHPKKTAWDSLFCNALQLRIPTSLCAPLHSTICEGIYVFHYLSREKSFIFLGKFLSSCWMLLCIIVLYNFFVVVYNIYIYIYMHV